MQEVHKGDHQRELYLGSEMPLEGLREGDQGLRDPGNPRKGGVRRATETSYQQSGVGGQVTGAVLVWECDGGHSGQHLL